MATDPKKVAEFRKHLSDRELDIFDLRICAVAPVSLQDLGDKFGISREETHEIEKSLLEKVNAFFQKDAASTDLTASIEGKLPDIAQEVFNVIDDYCDRIVAVEEDCLKEVRNLLRDADLEKKVLDAIFMAIKTEVPASDQFFYWLRGTSVDSSVLIGD